MAHNISSSRLSSFGNISEGSRKKEGGGRKMIVFALDVNFVYNSFKYF